MCDENGLTLNPKDPVYKLIVDIPDFYTNPVGNVARNALVSKLKGCTPGRHTTAWYDHSQVQTFRQIFFPNYSAVQYEEYVAARTGLSDEWWSGFSVAVLCQSMYWQTSDLRPQLLIDDINTKVNNYNRNIRAAGVGWYSYVLFQNFMKYSGDQTTAKKTYVDQICCEDWVTLKMKQYHDGTWENPDWEEFHHWAKLSSLGATDDEIAKVINKLRNLGLRIFPDVDVESWRSYFVWYEPDQLSHTDVDNDARNGETCEVYLPGFGRDPGTYMKEENSFEFTANRQPGSKFRSSPHSSCFSATTMVLMPDGSLKNICEIKIGDEVQTPSGPRKVRLISSPYANGRKLYGVNKISGLNFTVTHPFINGQRKSDNDPSILAVSPLNLIRNIPVIGYEGVGKLTKGTYLLGFESGTYQPHLVESVEEIQSDESDHLLYDLILEPDMSGHFQYIVGAKENLFVVASELPTYKNAKPAELMACSAILNAIDTVSIPLNMLLASCGQQLYLRKIDLIACMLSSNLSSYDHVTSDTSVASLNSTDLSEFLWLVANKFGMFTSSDGKYSLATGEAFAYLSARLGHQLASAIQLGYRIIQKQSDYDVMALSLLDMQTTAPVSLNSLFNPSITVQLDDLPPERYEVAENHMHFGVRIFKISYIQLHDVQKQREHHLKVVIKMDNGNILQASTYVNLPLQSNHRHYHLPIFNDQGEEKGILTLDVRYLSTTDMNEEKKSFSGWNEQKMLNYTKCLTKTVGELLHKLCEQK